MLVPPRQLIDGAKPGADGNPASGHPLLSISWQVSHPELQPQMVEPLRVHCPPVLQELPQAFQPSLGEKAAGLPIGFVPILTNLRSSIVWIAFGIFGSPFCGPARQMRRKRPFAKSG